MTQNSHTVAAVDFREVRARMDLPRTRILLERGCDKDIVRQLIEERLRDGHPCGDRGRRDFESAAELMAAYLLRIAATSSLVEEQSTNSDVLAAAAAAAASSSQPSLHHSSAVVDHCRMLRLIRQGKVGASFVDLGQVKRGSGVRV